MKQRTFSNLKFHRTRDPDRRDKRALMESDNAWGVSVVTGPSHYTTKLGPYELAVTKDGNVVHEWSSSGVYGWLPVYRVTELMREVQQR